MSTSVLPQLLQVDSELSTQAIALEAELNELQEKRRGIQTVIAMFESGNAPEMSKMAAVSATIAPVEAIEKARSARGTASETTSETTAAKRTSAKRTKATKPAAKTATKAKTAKTEAAKPGSKSKPKVAKEPKVKTTVKATRGRPAKAKAVEATPSAEAKDIAAKRSGRTANWQRYVQENYSKAPLPDVIVGVLQAQPNNIFKIADVMSAVFKEDMPKNHFLKARNRVSNILSAGARDGDWYRGRGGTYSVSEKAVKTAG